MIPNRVYVLCDEAKRFLQESIDRPPGSVESIESIQLAMLSERGYVYEFRDEKLYGVLMISFEPNTAGKQYLNVNILGGEDVKLWRDSLAKFLIDMTHQTDSQLIIVSRVGWEKLFPELKVIGSLYTLK